MGKDLVTKGVIVYDYLFNYSGSNRFMDRNICGAGVQVAVHAYDNDGREILFDSEPKIDCIGYNSTYDVVFDREKLFHVKRDDTICNMFCVRHHWSRIGYDIYGYFLECLCDKSVRDRIVSGLEEKFEQEGLILPEIISTLPVSEPVSVTESVFRTFLSERIPWFDTLDNCVAQVPSVRFVSCMEKEGILYES